MTISEIKDANKSAGHHFFDAATMRFFNSTILPHVYEGPGGFYFVTSEQFVGSDGVAAPRKYSVRVFNPENGDVRSAGEFLKLSEGDAKKAAKALASGDKAKIGELDWS